MRSRIARGLALFLCVASLGAAQGPNSSGTEHHRSKISQTSTVAQQAHPKLPKKKMDPYQVGTASWYGEQFDGKQTASGEPFDMYDLTAAHPTLPLGTRVKVTNLHNRKSVVVLVNDRGPVVDGRIIDLSYAAAQVLGFQEKGLQRVRLDVVQYPTVAYLRPVAQLP
jgi:rare lipoprotein A